MLTDRGSRSRPKQMMIGRKREEKEHHNLRGKQGFDTYSDFSGIYTEYVPRVH